MASLGPGYEGGRAPAGPIAPKKPGLQVLNPSRLTSSSLKVESLLTCWVASGKNSGQREATVLYWSQCDRVSLSALTLGRIWCLGQVKNVSFVALLEGQDNYNPAALVQIPGLSLWLFWGKYLPVQFFLPTSLLLGAQILDQSQPQCICLIAQYQEANSTSWCHKTSAWPQSQGWGLV